MIKNNYRILPLTKGFVAIIDAHHFRRVNRHKWYVHTSAGSKKKIGQPYARATINGRKVYLHRFIKESEIEHKCIYGCTERGTAWHVDHKNHQTLDCREENLEVVFETVNHSRRRKKKIKVDIKMYQPHIDPATTPTTEKGIQDA